MPRPLVAEPRAVTPALLRSWPLPTPSGGKEGRGCVLVVGGSAETPGAVLLAAEAALRCGAGKAQVATAGSVAAAVGVALPEALVRGLPETPSGAVSAGAAALVRDLAESADCVVVGPGLADAQESAALLLGVVDGLETPVVVDALALAALTEDASCLRHLEGRLVLTPNPGELAHTMHGRVEEIEAAPARHASELAEQAQAVVALGSSTSWVASPGGQVWCDDSGRAGLGVSGSGDVKAGIVGGLMARGATAAQAAVWAGHLHGRAGEHLAATVGPLGFLARDLLPALPPLLADLATDH